MSELSPTPSAEVEKETVVRVKDADGVWQEKYIRGGKEYFRAIQTVGKWADLEKVTLKEAVKCGVELERYTFVDKEFRIHLMSNRTVKITHRRSLGTTYVPLENVKNYDILLDSAQAPQCEQPR